jgi:5-methylcytosine-specific restriction protein B
MNTADRSLGQIDYALRRRFAFYTIKSDKQVFTNFYAGKNEKLGKTALEDFDKLKDFIGDNVNEDIDKDDIMVGHSYFMANTEEEYRFKKEYEIRPLLDEYRKDGIITASKEVFDVFVKKLFG